MTNREKLLGIATGSLLALFALYGIYSMVSSNLEKKRDEVMSLDGRVRKEKLEHEKGLRAQRMLYEFRKRSLPAEPDDAHRRFVHWLENQVREVGLSKEVVRFQGVPNTKKPYKELSYHVSGRGDIKQLTELLYRIHTADTLHRVRQINVRRQKENSKELRLDFIVDALSMDDIDGEQLQKELGVKFNAEELAERTAKTPIGTASDEKLALSLADYNARITTRNSFSPANQPPELTSSDEAEVEIGKRLSIKLESTDPEDNEVTYELDESAPESAEISSSGRLTWRPKELGEYEFKIFLTDSGIPAKEAMETIMVKVVPEKVVKVEEEPKEDPFDEAKLAVMTAIVQGPKSPKPQMCMYLRSEDEYQYLAAGDDIEIGEWSGVVKMVDPDHSEARIQTDDGDYILRLGQALADAKFVKAEVEEAAEDEQL